MLKKIILLITVLIISGCTQKNYKLLQDNPNGEQVSYSETDTATLPAKLDYRILKNDRLAITIYQHPELIPANLADRGILVDSNGDVSLPLVHRVHVAGLTQTQAAKKLERRFAKYLKNPALNLEVLNKRIYVLGEVNKPGAVNVDKEYMTILEAVAFAGGLKDTAERDNIIVVSRDANGRMKLRKIDLTNFNKLQASNIVIKPNDVIYVQPNGAKEFKIASDNITAPLKFVTDIVSPFAMVKSLSN